MQAKFLIYIAPILIYFLFICILNTIKYFYNLFITKNVYVFLTKTY